MKSSLIFLAITTLFSFSLASVVPTPPNHPSDNCPVPSLVAYCLDVMKLGSLYDTDDAGTPTLTELQTDVADVPMGSCSWADFAETVSAEDCIKALEEYSANDHDDDEEDVEIESSDRFIKKLGKKIKKAAKKVGKAVKKGVKKVGKGIKKAAKEIKKGAKKVAKFCSKNKGLCKKVVEIGKDILTGGKPTDGRTPPFNPNSPHFPNHPPHYSQYWS